ncbi:hypothetical protein PPERSA_03891 [Pseudocohnilembus persalinus]|uniref:Uncharacterized protein n=1 Tax=Pseudocohnilembus persalinus TaxID=266149 RepID=A0A0V0Q9M7_PSEPJ|nr:hypothetical protein PPERSA_03891 [Pseudocohnilembus persalinus]|eukprot:KRW98756.1 hypothetical protein PPERSA_03891 [Pseudocohnilembus persalinus]
MSIEYSSTKQSKELNQLLNRSGQKHGPSSTHKYQSHLSKQADPFNFSKVDELLQGVSDWRNIQEILRVTIKSLAETVRQQGETIQNMDFTLSQKVSKHDFISELYEKANQSDVNRNLADITQSMDTKVSYEELKIILKEEILNSDKYLGQDIALKMDELQNKYNKTLNQEVQQSINQILSTKADKSYLDTKLNGKIDSHEFNQLITILEGKADNSQLEKCQRQLEQKCENQELDLLQIKLKSSIEEQQNKFKDINKQNEKIFQEIQNKVALKDFEQLNQRSIVNQERAGKNEILTRDILIDIQNLKQDLEQYQQRNSNYLDQQERNQESLYRSLREDVFKIGDNVVRQNEDIRDELQENIKLVRNIANSVKGDIIQETLLVGEDLKQLKNDIKNQTVDREDYDNWREKLLQLIEEKVDVTEVQEALNKQQKDLYDLISKNKQETQTKLQNQNEENLNMLKKMVTLEAFQDVIRTKADKDVIERQMNTKASHQNLQDIQSRIGQIFSVLDNKVDQNQYLGDMKDAFSDIKDIRHELVKKVDDDKELSKKVSLETLQKINKDQQIINESLCTENIIGRWMWKSGLLKTGSQIPWEVQIVNTLPDNYLWEKEKSSIMVCAPGLYEILLGFFSAKKPSIQILVNGEPIISAAQRQDSSRFKEHKHSQGQLTGINIREVIILPQRARVSIIYNGDYNAEGFMQLKRL